MSGSDDQRKKTLSDGEIVSGPRKVGRRSALGMLGVAFTVGVAPSRALAASDSDTGRSADAPGRGRTGVTDDDRGASGDRAGHGRPRSRSGVTDTDGGRNADPVGNGRRRSPCSDSDGGQYADPPGRGRRC